MTDETMTTEERNKAVVRRFYEELWNGRRLGAADELFHPDCLTHQLRSGAEMKGAPRGPAAIKEHVAAWLAAFPDLRFTVEQLIAEGERVVSLSVMRGTHAGAWLGVAPTDRAVSLPMIVIQRLSEAKIVEDWVLVDSLGFYQQLGLLPPSQEILARATG